MPNVLTLLALLVVSALLVRVTPALRRRSVPTALLAGVIGLALGPSGMDVLPVDTDVLEVIVYHAFGVVFIAVGLQSAARTQSSGSARSFTVALAVMGVAQALLGFALVGAWMLLTQAPLHPGFSWMVTLGFMQGPGQALALGSAWESHGFLHGGQIGLIFAALGFAYCGVFGVPLVEIARRRGWIEAAPADDAEGTGTSAARATSPEDGSEPLSNQVLLIAAVYVATFGLLYGATSLLPEGSPVGSTLWGFHFIVGAALAIGLRKAARRAGGERMFDDDLLARISVIAVEVTTAGAIAAVRLDVLTAWLGPILFMSTIGGTWIVVTSVWAGRRLFPDQPFGHALVLLGASTGTISTGLALLRMIDPELKGPVARNVVIAAAASIPLSAPLFLAVIPFAVSLWTGSYATAMLIPAAILVGYLAVLLVVLARLTPARLLRPLTSWWPAVRGPAPPG